MCAPARRECSPEHSPKQQDCDVLIGSDVTLVAMIDGTREASSAPLDLAFSMIGAIGRSISPSFSTTPPEAIAATV